MSGPSNVLGEKLELCCSDPMTGFYRNGMCATGPDDHGLHTVCVRVTAVFLEFSRSRGNDLSTPAPAPQVYLKATHISALEYVDLEDLQSHAAEDES